MNGAAGAAPAVVRRRLLTGLKLGVTMALCTALYAAADWRAVAAQLTALDGRYLAAALALFVPQTLVSAWRWSRLVAPWRRLSLTEATAHTLIGSAWNLLVPSKLGDFSKAALADGGEAAVRKKLAGCVAVEKAADLAALAFATFIGLYAAPIAACGLVALLVCSGFIGRRYMRGRGTAFDVTACLFGTTLLWTLHLSQVHLFLGAAGVEVAWTTSLARVPAALLAGIVPAAFCGIGTRDAALVWLFADVASPAAMAVVGLLTALRYVVPGAAGIPLLWSRRRSARVEPSDRFANRLRSAPAVAN